MKDSSKSKDIPEAPDLIRNCIMLLVLNKRMADLFKSRKNQSAVSGGTYNKLKLVS